LDVFIIVTDIVKIFTELSYDDIDTTLLAVDDNFEGNKPADTGMNTPPQRQSAATGLIR
jgi:hypothetical protein